MTADRIPCINPQCRRTAPRSRHPDSATIICAKCWKAIPARIRDRWRALNRRERKLTRLHGKERFVARDRISQWERLADRFDRAWRGLLADVAAYFTSSPVPVGLEDFLAENGIGGDT